MVIDINFTPQRLKSLVVELEKRIVVATGQPVRLDIGLYLDRLRKYKANPTKDNLPNIVSLEKLSALIPRMQEEQLIDAFWSCLRHATNKRITSAILDYYFNNYSDSAAKEYLFNTIHTEVVNRSGWEIWSRQRVVFFKGDVTNNIANFIIQQRIPLQDIPKRLGMPEPCSIREDSLSCLCNNKSLLESYLRVLPLQSVQAILKDDQLQRLHAPIWNYTLPLYGEEAKEQKKRDDTDHPLFSLAKLRLRPTRSPQWLRLSKEAKTAYQEWALGSRIESFFEQDSNNARILFWKRHIRNIDELKEVNHRGSIEAFSATIGKYDFIEFKDVGAIYVYPKGTINIPNRTSDLSTLKFRNEVVHAGVGVEYGEGWIPHHGHIWTQRAAKLINEALRV
jgi:hypothetical protein